jgi:arginyl-tRNA synthetase
MVSRSGLEERVAGALREAVREAYGLDLNGVHVERPNEAAHGDFATNVALANAKVFKRNPREVAQNIVASLEAPFVESAEVAGPGFINFLALFGSPRGGVEGAARGGEGYGRREPFGDPVLLEYVSVNPTGPMTVAHGRHAAYG